MNTNWFVLKNLYLSFSMYRWGIQTHLVHSKAKKTPFIFFFLHVGFSTRAYSDPLMITNATRRFMFAFDLLHFVPEGSPVRFHFSLPLGKSKKQKMSEHVTACSHECHKAGKNVICVVCDLS